MIRIIGGMVFSSVGLVEADVWIDGDSVVAVGGEGRLTPDAVIDATGMLVGPGFVDLHTHLREPGQTWKETIDSGTRAASAGGYTAVVAMPNTEPATDTQEMVELVADRGVVAGNCHVAVAAALTLGRKGETAVDLETLHGRGVRLFTDDGDSLSDAGLLRDVMERIAGLPGAVVAQHAEDRTLSAAGHLHDGEYAVSTGLSGIPSEAEWSVIARDLGLAAATGARYHAQHLSTAEGVELVRQAKREGVPVTAEVTPHHLTFDDSALAGLDTNLKMYPPIRSISDRDVLRSGLADGTIDVVATDHAPHSDDEKAVSFEEAPRGVIGLETAAAAVWDVLDDAERFFAVMSVNPAQIAGLERHGVPIGPGSPANLVIFDPEREWTVTTFRSRSANSPYLGRVMRGRPMVTIYEGVITNEMEGVR